MTFTRLLAFAPFIFALAVAPPVRAQSDALKFLLDEARRKREAQQKPVRQRPAFRAAPRIIDVPRRAPAPTVIVRDTPEKPRVEATTFVLVLGDSFAELLAGGLEEAFAEQPEVAIVRRSRPESGLVRSDFYDWQKGARDLAASDQKISFVVIQMGANDRQTLRDETGLVHEPGSDRWKEIYAQRVEAVVRAFAERRTPVFWVGMPPMQFPKYSADMLAQNDLVRAAVQKAGGTFVDIWDAFSDSQSRFVASGPDLTGQNARLRTSDGVHLTKPGARKAAHFIELQLKRQIEGGPGATVIAAPTIADPAALPIELQPGGVERAIDRMVSALPEPVGLPALPTPVVKPLAGPIIPLNRPETAAGGALAQGAGSRLRNEASDLIERVFGEGRPLESRPGRADDFRWPAAR